MAARRQGERGEQRHRAVGVLTSSRPRGRAGRCTAARGQQPAPGLAALARPSARCPSALIQSAVVGRSPRRLRRYPPGAAVHGRVDSVTLPTSRVAIRRAVPASTDRGIGGTGQELSSRSRWWMSSQDWLLSVAFDQPGAAFFQRAVVHRRTMPRSRPVTPGAPEVPQQYTVELSSLRC